MDFTTLWAQDKNAQSFYYNATGTSHPNAPDVSYPAAPNLSDPEVNNEPRGSSKRSLEGPFVTSSEKRIKLNPVSASDAYDFFASTPDDDDDASDDDEDPFIDFSSLSPSLDNFEAYNHVYFYGDAAGLFDNDGEEFRNPFLDDRDVPGYPRAEAPVSPLFGINTSPATGEGMWMEREGDSPIFCPVPRRDSRWAFVMDDSDEEGYGSKDEEDDEIVHPALYPLIRDDNYWSFMMDDSDDESAFSISDYEMEVEPASPPRSDNETWSSEGNPFSSAMEHSQLSEVFADMDVEGLIYDGGFELEDNDHLRYPADQPNPFWVFEPHSPGVGCECHWYESYRVGGNWEPHDPTIWCSCFHCSLFRAKQLDAEFREQKEEEERRWDEQMRRMHAESREAVKEETRCIDLMDFVPDEDQPRQSRADLFRTIKDRLRTRSPRP